jgi:nucleolin
MAIDDGCKLFVAGLPDVITEDVLRQLFEATGGTVVEVSIPRDRATGRSRGFAFVTLATEDEASTARDSLDNSMQSGRSISVRPFQAAPPKRGEARDRAPGMDRRDRGERFERDDRADPGDRGGRGERVGGPRGADDRTLYLGNLPYEASPADVEALLEGAGVGPVVRVTLPQDADGRARGFGFVTLGSAETAQAAVETLANAELRGRRISASIARGRGERGPGTGPPAARPMRSGPPREGYAPRSDGPSFRGPPPPMEAPPFGPPGAPDENRRGGEGRRRKDAKKKKKSGASTDRDDGRRGGGAGGADRARARRGRWDDDGDDY